MPLLAGENVAIVAHIGAGIMLALADMATSEGYGVMHVAHGDYIGRVFLRDGRQSEGLIAWR
jgi:hypothetical protein